MKPIENSDKRSFNPSLSHSLSHMIYDFKSQKSLNDIFDNSKIKSVVPGWKTKVSLHDGLKETISWINEDDIHKRVDSNLDDILDKVMNKFMFLL